MFCFGTVCWNGYLERYIDIFINNYIVIFRKLINLGVNYTDIADPKVCYNNDIPGPITKNASERLKLVTGKTLQLISNDQTYSVETIMYSMRNNLRNEFRKSYPTDKKVFLYFPVDDSVRPEIAIELLKLSRAEVPSACMFKFFVSEKLRKFSAATRPITSHLDIHSGDWGGYCAYNILDEDKCPLYPEIAIPNVAFYIELYKAGYKEYASKEICIDHLRHPDSHHFKYKDSTMSEEVREYLIKQREILKEKRM